jgi:hypothetical protein
MELRPRAGARATRTPPAILAFAALAGLAALIIASRVGGSLTAPRDTRTERQLSTSSSHSRRMSASDISNTTTARRIIMLTRYFSWLAIGVAAAFLVVASTSFTSLTTIAWLAFGISTGTLVISAGIAYRYRNHVPTLVTAVATAVVSAWTIVASLIFSQPTGQNLALAGSLAIAALALVGLTADELTSERVTHSLEVGEDRRESQLAAAA